jgi:hypothetical protein
MPSSLRKQVLRPLQSSWLYLRWLDHQIAQLKEEIDALHEQARSQSVLIDRNRQLTQQWKSFSKKQKHKGKPPIANFAKVPIRIYRTPAVYMSLNFCACVWQIQRQEISCVSCNSKNSKSAQRHKPNSALCRTKCIRPAAAPFNSPDITTLQSRLNAGFIENSFHQ